MTTTDIVKIDESNLIEWEAIKTAIVTCKDIVVMSKYNYSLEAIQKWAKQSQQSKETQNEIAEYRLRLNRKQGEWIQQNIPEDGGKAPLPTENSQLSQITLAEAGIDRNDSPKFRILAKIPEKQFEDYFTAAKADGEEITTSGACQLWNRNKSNKWTGDPESYTPALYVEAARSVMGSIDTDPASDEMAQEIIKASVFYTIENDGLKHSWNGNIFLNPPYSHPEVKIFINKLLSELKPIQQAILLTNNNTDTAIFHKAAAKASAVCFTKGRINFHKPDGSLSSPTNGQVFFYFGNNDGRFAEYFKEFGLLMKVM